MDSHAAAPFTRQLDLIIGVDDLEDVAGLERSQLLEEPYLLLCPAGIPATRTHEAFVRFSARFPPCRLGVPALRDQPEQMPATDCNGRYRRL